MKVRDLKFSSNGEFHLMITYKCRSYKAVVYRFGRRYKLYIKLCGNEMPVCDCYIPVSHCADANCLIAYALN